MPIKLTKTIKSVVFHPFNLKMLWSFLKSLITISILSISFDFESIFVASAFVIILLEIDLIHIKLMRKFYRSNLNKTASHKTRFSIKMKRTKNELFFLFNVQFKQILYQTDSWPFLIHLSIYAFFYT